MEPQASRTQVGARLAAQTGALRLCLTHLAGRALRARVEIDDLIQEVFVRALADPSALPPEEAGEGRLRRWLAQIARHVTIDVARALRAAKRDGAHVHLERSAWSHGAALDLPLDTPGPATRAGNQDELERLLAAFQRLAPDHRRVLGLRQFEGLDARATGLRMGRGESAVHSLYRRALAAWALEAGGPREA